LDSGRSSFFSALVTAAASVSSLTYRQARWAVLTVSFESTDAGPRAKKASTKGAAAVGVPAPSAKAQEAAHPPQLTSLLPPPLLLLVRLP
jgi:hypothetical protein